MKISLFLNNYFTKYNSQNKQEIINLNYNIIKNIYNEKDTFILRGEPTLRNDLHKILSLFKKNNYILMTDCSNLNILTQYKSTIPYITFYWDGIINDSIRNKNLNLNLFKALNYFSGKETITRLTYTINNLNLPWINVDSLALRNFISIYPKMKLPYIVLFQQTDLFQQNNFIWPKLSKLTVNEMNKKSILTEKTYKSLLAWCDKKPYNCIAPQNEIIVMYDGTVRTCMSYRFNEILGDLNTTPFSEILKNSEKIRTQCTNCPFREKCWLSYHHKDSINGIIQN